MTPAALIAQAQALVDPFLLDTCDLIGAPTSTSDGFSGHTLTASTVISNVSCMIEQLGGAGTQVVAGGITYTCSHRLFMKATAQTLAITPLYQIRVHANGDKPQMLFEQPVRHEETFSPLLTISAILTIKGFREPGLI